MSDPSTLVLCDVLDGVATLTLNRPERRNALSLALLDALIARLTECAARRDVRALILAGAGKDFCSGGDLSPPSGDDEGGLLSLHQGRQRFIDVFEEIQRLGKPLIVAVQGRAFAGGLGLMLAADIVIAADDALFATPEVKVGLFPMMIMALIFRNIGRKKGMELILTGDPISAHEAAQLGLINRAVPPDQLHDAARAFARKLAALSPAVLRLGRDAFYQSQDMDFSAALQFLRAQLTLNTLTEDAAEGITSFLMKRPPSWTGR
jgi:enoyl-CoA hydratase/carnithine racemase